MWTKLLICVAVFAFLVSAYIWADYFYYERKYKNGKADEKDDQRGMDD